jgi:DNA invertase Pin-like site-specific DNA recombinase
MYVFGRGRIDYIDPNHRGRMLAAAAAKGGWHVLHAYCDSAGTRPELMALQAAIMAGKIQALMLHDIAELGSTVVAVVESLAWLREQGVHLCCLHPMMDTGDPYGRRCSSWQATSRSSTPTSGVEGSRPAPSPGAVPGTSLGSSADRRATGR